MDNQNQKSVPVQDQPADLPAEAAPLPPAPAADRVTVTTPNGTVVVLKGYLSGGDMDELSRVFAENIVYTVDPESGQMTNPTQQVKGSVIFDRRKKALELLVISVNGSTDKAAQKVLDLPVADYDTVRDAVNKITDESGPLAQQP